MLRVLPDSSLEKTTVTYYRRQRFESFKRAMFARQLNGKTAPRLRALHESGEDRQSPRPVLTQALGSRPH
jgi:hypothetical protein